MVSYLNPSMSSDKPVPTDQSTPYYEMEIVEEGGKTYAVFYDDKGGFAGRTEVDQTVEEWIKGAEEN
jgi:hypothetical protein